MNEIRIFSRGLAAAEHVQAYRAWCTTTTREGKRDTQRERERERALARQRQRKMRKGVLGGGRMTPHPTERDREKKEGRKRREKDHKGENRQER